MSVNGFLASMAINYEDADPVLLQQVWTLAEQSADVEILVALLSRKGVFPEELRARARLRKETEVRVAYLTRSDVSTEERAELLESEKRSDVFAGLIAVAKDNLDLAARLAEQLEKKPTKVLSRTMLREGFDHGDASWIALQAVASDKTMPQQLESRVVNAAAKYARDPERCGVLVEILGDQILITLDPSVIPASHHLRYVERMLAVAITKSPHWDWELRRRASSAADQLIKFTQRDGLSTEVLALLEAATSNDDFSAADQVAALLAGRLSLETRAEDDRYDAACTVTGVELDRMIDFALVGDPVVNAGLLQGLLENPAARSHKDFSKLLAHVKPVTMVRAMASSKSLELFVEIWRDRHQEMPEDCWGFLSDPDQVMDRLMQEEVKSINDPDTRRYYGGVPQRLMALLERGVPAALVATLPFEVFNTPTSYYQRWASAHLISVVGAQVAALQAEFLGTDQQRWENFNNLASSWSGTLGELLEASCTL
jgi:hypothetical protein